MQEAQPFLSEVRPCTASPEQDGGTTPLVAVL